MALWNTDTDLAIYPEEYLVEEDEEMSESAAQFFLIKYLVEVLEWYYQMTKCLIIGNLELKHPAILNSQHKITPDILVFLDKVLPRPQIRQLTSWKVVEQGAPALVFEVCSRSTWPTDIGSRSSDKPSVYGRIGVKEYWAYDPNDPAVWPNVNGNGRRLMGWRYDAVGQPQPIVPDERGWYWSELLESWLVEDGELLRLYDRAGQPRLEGKAAAALERAARLKAERAERAEQQARLKAERAEQQARQQIEAERAAREQAEQEAQQQIEAERAARERAEQQARLQIEAERAAREQAESRMAEMEAELRRLRGEQP